MFENITRSFQESIAGWKMFFGGGMQSSAQFGGDISKSEIGTALIGPGFSAAQQRFVGIKAGGVSAQVPGEAAPVGVRYIPSKVSAEDPGTPATVVKRIQKSIGNSVEGWRMGYAYVAGKAKEAVTGAQKGISSTVGGVGESFANVGESIKSVKWGFYILIPIIIFIAIMVAIGYSGVGAPAARVAEREYVKRR